MPPCTHVNRCLVVTLTERWWPITYSFHFSDFDLAFTPLNFYMLTGIKVKRANHMHVPFDANFEPFDPYSQYLPSLDEEDATAGATKLTRLQTYIRDHRDDPDFITPVITAFSYTFLVRYSFRTKRVPFAFDI